MQSKRRRVTRPADEQPSEEATGAIAPDSAVTDAAENVAVEVTETEVHEAFPTRNVAIRHKITAEALRRITGLDDNSETKAKEIEKVEPPREETEHAEAETSADLPRRTAAVERMYADFAERLRERLIK